MLSVVTEGMPLACNGQEAGCDKRLEFFHRDPIQWREHPFNDLYRRLFALKHANSALWNAPWEARMVRVPNSDKTTLLSFVRANEQDTVFAVFNFSAGPVTFREALYDGHDTDFGSGEEVDLSPDLALDMAPRGYRVFVR